jgi:hypothetical protein
MNAEQKNDMYQRLARTSAPYGYLEKGELIEIWRRIPSAEAEIALAIPTGDPAHPVAVSEIARNVNAQRDELSHA